MNHSEIKGINLALADLGKQFNRLSERLENLDSVLFVKFKKKVLLLSKEVSFKNLQLSDFPH